MSKAVGEIAAGAGLGLLVALAPFTAGLSAGLAMALYGAAGSLVLGGLGTLLTKGPLQGISGQLRNPIQPWNAVYGLSKVGGTTVFIEDTGESDKYLHMVIVLACHPCDSIQQLLFDTNRVTLDTSGNSLSYQDSTSVIAHNQYASISHIARVGDLVTVTMAAPMPFVASTAVGPPMVDGDKILITGVSTDPTLNGTFPITVVSSTVFTCVNGGAAASISGQGRATTTFVDYGDSVHMEVLLGNHTSTFAGLLAGGGSGSNGYWTANHKLLGKTSVYLRLKFGGNTYLSGLPSIGFIIKGKNDIYDPRTGTTGYTDNSALCIADYLSNTAYGFKAAYTTEIPTNELIAAANICDESVTLANGGTEHRYTCNGGFSISSTRGEILQNLLTSCGGRITYVGGEFVIWPAAYVGASVDMGSGTSVTVIKTPSKAGLGKALYIGTGSSPANWQTLAFDDSSWTAPVLQTGSIAGAPITGSDWITDSAVLRGDFVQTLYRYSFTLSSAIGATLDVAADNWLIGVWINGTRIYTGSPLTGGSLWPAVSIKVPLAALVTTGTNVIAVQIQNADYSNPSPTSLNFNLEVVSNMSISMLPSLTGSFLWRGIAGRDLYNGVKGSYLSPSNSWQRSDIPPYAQDVLHGYISDANLAADGGDRRWYDLQLPFTISTAMAQRLCKIELKRRRYWWNGTFSMNMTAYPLSPMTVATVTLPVFGWTSKLLEVSNVRLTANRNSEEIPVLGTELDMIETDPSIYTWSASEELNAQGFAVPALPSMSTPPGVPTAATATSGSTTTTVGADGVARSRILVTWTAPVDGYVANGGSIQAQYQKVGDTTWTALPSMDPSVTQLYIDGVTDGQQYNVQIRSVNAAGAVSAWVTIGPVTVSGTASAIAPTAISAVGSTAGQVLTSVGGSWVASSLPLQTTEVPSGTLGGGNVTFTLAHTPLSSVVLVLNGVIQSVSDFSLSGSTITYAIPPVETDWHIAIYSH